MVAVAITWYSTHPLQHIDRPRAHGRARPGIYAGVDTPSPSGNGPFVLPCTNPTFSLPGAHMLTGLLDAALADPALRRLADLSSAEVDVTAPVAARPFIAATVARQRPVLMVTATSREAEDLAEALG